MFLVTYFSKYDDRSDYMWFNSEREVREFIEDCKEMGNTVHQAIEIKDFRRLDV